MPKPDPTNGDTSDPQSSKGYSTFRALSLFDCVCIIVGTIIGAGIFKTPSSVAAVVPSPFWMILVWCVGGSIALIGALCFAELTTTYPDRGGDYGYLKRAFGPKVGFAFSWTAFWVIRPANIGAMAVMFGDYAVDATVGAVTVTAKSGWSLSLLFATLALLLTSGVNLIGLTAGKLTQNLLAVAKVIGILLIVLAAFLFSPSESPDPESLQSLQPVVEAAAESTQADEATGSPSSTEESPLSTFNEWFWLAMVFVMFTFGGWNDIAFVASEVREPRKNLLRSLILGTGTVLLIYLLVNLALLLGLGFERIAQYNDSSGMNAPTVLVSERLGEFSGRLVAVLVCVSCLGATSAMIFTSPRIYWATAMDYPSLQWLAGTQQGQGWWRSMVLQTLVTLLFVIVFGLRENKFEDILVASAPYFWSFLAITVSAMIVSRIRFAGQFSGYRTPWFPVLPVLFIVACLFMVERSTRYMWATGMHYHALGIGVWVVLGVLLSVVLAKSGNQAGPDEVGP